MSPPHPPPHTPHHHHHFHTFHHHHCHTFHCHCSVSNLPPSPGAQWSVVSNQQCSCFSRTATHIIQWCLCVKYAPSVCRMGDGHTALPLFRLCLSLQQWNSYKVLPSSLYRFFLQHGEQCIAYIIILLLFAAWWKAVLRWSCSLYSMVFSLQHSSVCSIVKSCIELILFSLQRGETKLQYVWYLSL